MGDYGTEYGVRRNFSQFVFLSVEKKVGRKTSPTTEEGK